MNRRTEKSENLTSRFTEKSFRGIVNGTDFKVISSVIGKGAFCVMTGKINSDSGVVKVEIHKVFKILLGVFMFLPIFGLVAMIWSKAQEFSPNLIVVMVGQILIIRFVFIGLAFKRISKDSLNRLRDVLDFEWIEN